MSLYTQHWPLADAKLPTGWRVEPVKAVTSLMESGYASGRHNKDGTGIPHLRPMNVSPGGRIVLDDVRYVSRASGDKRLRRNDVLFNNTNSPIWVGKTALVDSDDELAFSNHMTRIRVARGHDPRFVAAQLNFLCASGYFRGLCKKHVNQASVSTTKLGTAVPLVVPPLETQHRIVAKLDAIHARTRAARAALEVIPPLVEKFRQSVLAAAFRGDLTADWRAENPDVEPASELLKRIRVERRERWIEDYAETHVGRARKRAEKAGKAWGEAEEEKKRVEGLKKGAAKYVEPEPVDAAAEGLPELPESWCWARLEELAVVSSGITKNASKSVVGSAELPYLRVANVQAGYLDLQELKRVPVSPEKLPSVLLKEGDILFTEGGDRDKLGRGFVWQSQVEECVHQNHIFKARPVSAEVRPFLVSWFGNSPLARRWFESRGKQTTNLASINQGQLRALPVPICPRDESCALLSRIEGAVVASTERSDGARRAAECVRQLKRSALAKAFRGELVQ